MEKLDVDKVGSVACNECGVLFQYKRRGKRLRKFCSRACVHRHLTRSLKGRKITWGDKITKSKTGFIFTDASKEKMRKSHLGQVPWNKGLKGYLCGNKHYNWKGGITPCNIKARGSIEYRMWRKSVFARDNYTCVLCGLRSAKGVKATLHADHIKPFCNYPELRLAIDNGRTLCVECHKKTDTYLWKAKNK